MSRFVISLVKRVVRRRGSRRGSRGRGGRLLDAHEDGGDEAPDQLIETEEQSRRHLARVERRQGGDRRPQAPRRMTAVEIKHVGIPVLEFALNRVVKREETVLREMAPLVESNRPLVRAKNMQEDGFAGMMIFGRQVTEEII